MRSLEEIVALGKDAAETRDLLAAAGKAATDPAERAKLGKHWKTAETKVRELQAEYVAAKAASKVVEPPKLTTEQMEQRLIGFQVAVGAVVRAASLPQNTRNKTLVELAVAMRRDCSRLEAELMAAKEVS
jgi:hypothetical protein